MIKAGLIFLGIFISCKQPKLAMNTERIKALEIHFQRYFNNDKVSLTVNGFNVVKDWFLVSDVHDDYTYAKVEVFKQNNLTSFIKTKSKIKDTLFYSSNLSDSVEINVSVNDHDKILHFDLSKGRNIGISKKGNDSLYVIQSKIEFLYY